LLWWITLLIAGLAAYLANFELPSKGVEITEAVSNLPG
jgi:hypothetical protein